MFGLADEDPGMEEKKGWRGSETCPTLGQFTLSLKPLVWFREVRLWDVAWFEFELCIISSSHVIPESSQFQPPGLLFTG